MPDREYFALVRKQIINSPETADFMAAVPLEAAHQRERWGADHDAGKSPYDWFWLIGYLSQKAADAAVRGDTDKALHHTISTAAALANWHASLAGLDSRMMPGAPLSIQPLGDASDGTPTTPPVDAAADMRERCAKACEAEADRIEAMYVADGKMTDARAIRDMTARHLAHLIRALPLTLTGEGEA